MTQRNLSTKQKRLTDLENRLTGAKTVQGWGGEGKDWELELVDAKYCIQDA